MDGRALPQLSSILQAPRLAIAGGTLELLKWSALLFMTLDHTNVFLLSESLSGVPALGRLAMPLFGFILAYNLARPGALRGGSYRRVLMRLAFFGALATPFHIVLVGQGESWLPLNILFTLWVAAAIMYLTEQGRPALAALALPLFLVGGVVVDYWWFGVSFCLAAWWYCRAPSGLALVTWIMATALLCLFNENIWALAVFPVLFAASFVRLNIPRLRLVFYAYYPAHLALLVALR